MQHLRFIIPFVILLPICLLMISCNGGNDGNSNEDGTTEKSDDDNNTADDDDNNDNNDNDDNDSDTEDSIDLVNLFVGSGGVGYGAAHLHPGPQMPNGMTRPGPDTSNGPWFYLPEFHHYSGYWFGDSHIRGFSQNRMIGTGDSDYGNVRIMPVYDISNADINGDRYFIEKQAESEIAEVGRYEVTLANQIRIETTAGKWSTLYRIHYMNGKTIPHLLVDIGGSIRPGDVWDSEIEIDPAQNGLSGRLWQAGEFSDDYGGLAIYFVLSVSENFTDFGTFDENGLATQNTESSGPEAGAYFVFEGSTKSEIVVKIGLSHISIDQARQNLAAEIPQFDFDGMVQGNRQAWRERLSIVQVEGGTATQRSLFYTMLYRSFIMPTLFTEANGKYMGFDAQTHSAQGFEYYTDMSLWDTFRTLHPLVTLLDPALSRDFVVSLLKMAQQGGCLPRWPQGIGYTESMIGTHADSVISEAYIKGITDFDTGFALDQMELHANEWVPYANRDDLENYLDLGYCAADSAGESVSMTLEYAYDDFCIAKFAESLGMFDKADKYYERSGNYANLWHPQLQFFCGKKTTGQWAGLFAPRFPWLDTYTQGNAWHWLWFVPHDPEGLINLFGSADSMAEKLELFFELSSPFELDALPNPYYWHGNQHDLHSVFMFNSARRPDLTQYWSRHILETDYQNNPHGLSGNEDGGTLAAWYVFAALGIFPMNPCGGVYEIGSPIFDRATLQLPGGNVVITALNNGPENPYIQSATIDGQPLERTYLTHQELADGANIEFVLGATPSDWGK